MKNIGKPCAGIGVGRAFAKQKLAKPHARFDEGGQAQACPLLYLSLSEGGRVMVHLERTASGELQLRVSDDGPGIAIHDRARMFERFRRGAGVKASGAGLGLAIVSSAARQLQARIDVRDGLEGRGVCIALTWGAKA